MTALGADATRAALEGLRARGIVADLDPVTIAEVITGQADEYARACRERDAALARLRAIWTAVYPLIDEPGAVGALARAVSARSVRDTTT